MLEKFVSEKTNIAVESDLKTALFKINSLCNQTVVDKSIEFALAKITEKEAAFRHQDLVKEALYFALSEETNPLNHDQIEKKLNELKESGFLLSADYEDGVRWTTKEVLLLEKDILNLIIDGKQKVTPLADTEFTKNKLNNSQLTQSQQEAVFLITTTKDRFVAIQGLPGTGKSTMLLNVLDIVDETKKISGDVVEFVGLAPTWQAVNELKDKGVSAQTLASFLQEIKSDIFDKEKYKNTVFLLDESSMVSNKDAAMFLNALKFANARAIQVGDMEQLQGQGGGKPFELAIKRGVIEYVSLTDIVRQNPSPILKYAVENIIDKDVKSAFRKIEHQKSFESFGSKNSDISKKAVDEFIAALDVKNIIETWKEVSTDSKINNENARLSVLEEGAKEYLARTPESRANSIFIAYSNLERDMFASMIRAGLKNEQIIDKRSEIPAVRLRPLNLTRAEMRIIDAYTPKFESDLGSDPESKDNKKSSQLMLSIGKNKYYEITDVDKKRKLVTLVDVVTQETKIFNQSKSDHSTTCIWIKTIKPLACGDLVVLRRRDKDRDHFANVEYKVQSTDARSKALMLKNDVEELILNTSEMRDCHWDYAYSKTTDMSQSATRKYVVPMVYSKSPLTDIRRAIVDLSRATTHGMLIVDKKEDLIARLEGRTLQAVASNHGNKRSALDTIEKVVHAPTRYFDKVDSKNIVSDNVTTPVNAPPKNTADSRNRILSAQSIYNGTKNISGTLGELYLHKTRHISIDTISRSEVRFWEKNAHWSNTNEQGELINQKNKMNAIVIPAVDKDGNLTGVQRIYFIFLIN